MLHVDALRRRAPIDPRPARATCVLLLAVAVAPAGCGGASTKTARTGPPPRSAPARSAPTHPRGPAGVYAADAVGDLSPRTHGALARIYVPNSLSDTVDVIDPTRFRVVGHFPVGGVPQHVTPSHDLRTLYVDSEGGNTLTPIDPTTARPRGRSIPVVDPYNLYFTPDGRLAIVVAERLQRLDSVSRARWPCAVRCPSPRAWASTTWISRPAATRSSRAASSPGG